MIYVPLLPIYILGVIYTRRWLYFTAVNPGIDMGGFFGERKDEILALIPNNLLANGISIKNGDLTGLKERMSSASIVYPVIAKPNVGERGEGVRKLESYDEITSYAKDEPDFIIQEFVTFDLELGLLYTKMPKTGEVKVTSLAKKEYLRVLGDGHSSVKKLLKQHNRNFLYLDLVKREYPNKLNIVPGQNEIFYIHKIGNHIKGTRFINSADEITEKLEATVAKLADQIDGVYYGRFDLKVPSFRDLELGLNYKIFELNGVSSEPIHIYDLPNVFQLYGNLAKHWFILMRIAKQNIKKGVKTTPLFYFLSQVKNHFS
ncbi:MAG: hypothetical protein RLZZ337_226 [Bacteroidota bacterium]|jgi:hypothetical protein